MTEEAPIVVICLCGKKLKAPATAAGKKARCPACSRTVVIEPFGSGRTAATPANKAAKFIAAQTKPAPAPPAAPPPEDDTVRALHALADQAEAAAASNDGIQCPRCRSAMDDGSVLCTECGYDTRTGKALSTQAAATQLTSSSPRLAAVAGTRGRQPVNAMAPEGSFLLGLGLSAAFAVAASVVWVLVAWLTGLAIGYIAILIGAAAGAGMKTGHKGFSIAGGWAAAGMTLLAILIAKLVVLEIILSRDGITRSVFDLDPAALARYFFTPIGTIIILIGMAAAFRTASGSVRR